MKWGEENLQEWLEVVDAVYGGSGVSREAIFVHGWADLIPETMSLVAELYHEGEHPAVVLNGLPSYGLAVSGVKEGRDLLLIKGVADPDIYEIAGAQQTGEEARKFMVFAEERKLSSAVVVSVPQHLLRAFLTDLGVMQSMRLNLALYPRTVPTACFDWQGSYSFMPLLKAEPEKTTRLARFATECVRILEYRSRMEAGDESHRIASISEAHRYLHQHKK